MGVTIIIRRHTSPQGRTSMDGVADSGLGAKKEACHSTNCLPRKLGRLVTVEYQVQDINFDIYSCQLHFGRLGLVILTEDLRSKTCNWPECLSRVDLKTAANKQSKTSFARWG